MHAWVDPRVIRYRSDFEYATQRPSGISALLLRPYWSVIWRVSLWWIAFTLLGSVVVIVFFTHQLHIVDSVNDTFECSMLHPVSSATPNGCVLAFQCQADRNPLIALQVIAFVAVCATALSRNLVYARLWWGGLPPPRHDVLGWWFSPEETVRAKMAQSTRMLRRDEARINFPPIVHNDALVQLPHVWHAYFRLFVDPGDQMAHSVKHAVQVCWRQAQPLPLVDFPLTDVTSSRRWRRYLSCRTLILWFSMTTTNIASPARWIAGHLWLARRLSTPHGACALPTP